MLFSHGTVPYLKQTVNLNGSRVFRSDRTVRSGFNNLVIQLTLSRFVSYNVVKEKTTINLMKVLSGMYEKLSINKKVHLMKKLFNLNKA